MSAASAPTPVADRRARRPGAAARLNGWLAGSDALEAGLRHSEAASLFNPARLRAAAIAPLPGKAP